MSEPGQGQIRVHVRAFGLNRAELLQRRGLYPAPPGCTPDIPGLEHAGEVDAVGPGVEGVAVGDRVMGIVCGGSYAEYLITPAAHVMPIPAGLSFDEAAAIPEAFITAYDALERVRLKAGEWVLVHAAGSGVGTAAVQLAKAWNARCIGTSRTPAKLERVAELGMDIGIDSVNEDFVHAVRQATEDGVDAVVDLIGGASFPQTLEAMAPCGRLILVGLTAGRRADLDLAVITRRRLRIEGTVLRSRSEEEKTALTQSFTDAVLPLFADGRVQPVVDRVFAFGEIRAAHEYLESNQSFGNVVVRLE
jgi:putative PIG3 family NAD(P)H quinone oxidoreductase